MSGTGRSRRKVRGVSPDASRHQKGYSIKYQEAEPVENEEYSISSKKSKNRSRKKKSRGRVADPNKFSSDDTDNNSYRDDGPNVSSDELEKNPRSLRMQLLQSRMTEGNVSGPKQKKSKKSSHNEKKSIDAARSSTKGKKSRQKDEYDFCYDEAVSVNSSDETESTPARHFNNDQTNSKTSPITLKLSKLDSKKWSRKTESKSKSAFSKSKNQSEPSITDADDSDMVSLSSEKCWKSETPNQPLGSPSCKSDASSDDTIENNPVPNMELAQQEYSSTDEEETKSCDKPVRRKLKDTTVSLGKYDSDQKWKVQSSDGAAVKLTCKKSSTGGMSVHKEEKPSVYSPSKSHGSSSVGGTAQKNYDAVSSGESTEIEEYNDITVVRADNSPLHQPVPASKTEDKHEDEFFRVGNRKAEKLRGGDTASGEGLKSSSTPNVEKLARRGGDDRPASQRVSANVELATRRAEESNQSQPSSVQKRKPGRPRKVTQNIQPPTPDNDEEFSTPAPKDMAETDGGSSKRARKKPSMFHNYEVATPRRKQKSPRRIILNVEQSSMYDAEMDANYDESELSPHEENEDSKEDTLAKIQMKKQEPTQQCPRCDAMLGSQTSLKYHLMSVHQVLWTKECPMGSTDNKALKFIMKKMGKLNCPKCGKEVRNFQYYNFHIEWCGREDEVAECPVCHKNQRLMYMASHVNLHKRKERIELERQKLVQRESGTQKSQRKRKAAEKAIGSLHEMSQELFSTDEMGDHKQPKKARHLQSVDYLESNRKDKDDDDNFNYEEFDEGFKHVPSHSETHVSTPRSSGGASMWPSKDEDLFECCLQFHTKQEVLCPAFDEFLPTRDMFYHLTNEEIDLCLPIIRKSIDFTVDLLGREVHMSLGLFGSAVCGDSLNFFTGGPVWCAVWCPIPTTEGVNADQYMAVYSHKHMDETNVVKKAFTKTTVIQIWNCGPLNAFSEKLFLPHIAFGIVHDFGCVFSMAWCPFGAWQSCSQPVYQEEVLHRLGLLAAACSDGSVRIFSVPYASDLLEKDQCVGTYQFYRVKPSISLIPLPDQSGSTGSCCLCVDWQHGEERRYIVAGYADGATRLWDLKTQSPLLRTSISMDMSDVFLYPIRCFKSHLSEVRAVCWSQTVHDTFATCGADRDVKFWKSSDTSFPFCCEKFCQCMNARWVQPWNGVVVAQDDAFCFDHCCAYYQDAGYCLPDLYGRRSVMWHNACIWDVTHSSWLNVAVTCDSTGTLMLFKCMNLWRGNKSKKLMYRRHLLYETDVIPTNVKEGVKPDISALLDPRTYDEIVPKCQLTYKDKKMDVIKADVKFGSGKNLPRERVGSYPLPALYKVNFNPNFGSCSWLLSAGQAGLVRLHNLSGLFSANQRRIWTSQINR